MIDNNLKKINWWWTSFDEDDAIALNDAVSTGTISEGKKTAEFEEMFADYLNVPYAVATTSGSVALLIACMVAKIKMGDEVIIPDRTWVATANAPYFVKAKPILLDTYEQLPIIDYSLIDGAITENTKAIIPVHINGRDAGTNRIKAIAKKNELIVIEDAAQALGSKNKSGYLGTQSDMGCFSLGITKLIPAGQGGVVVTREKELYKALKLVKSHGVVDNYTEAWNDFGFNFKLTDLQATLAIKQLGKIEEKIDQLESIYSFYENGLANLNNVSIIPVDLSKGEMPLWVEAISPYRDQALNYLKSYGINCRPYHPSLHRCKYFESTNQFPNSIKFEKQSFILPCGPDQPLENVNFTIQKLQEFDDEI